MFQKNKVNPLFIRTLQWAYDRGSVGFKLNELKEAVTSNEGEWVWVQRMMLGEIHGDPPLISHLGAHHIKEGEYDYFLTGSGASALVDYLELKESRKNANTAMGWAIASFMLAAVVGGFQIWSTYLTRDSLELTREQLTKLSDPFFNVEYEVAGRTFEINAPADIKIIGVDWYLQDATEDFRFGDQEEKDRFIKLEGDLPELKISTIADYLSTQMSSKNKNLTSEQLQYFVKCYDEYYPAHTLSAIITIYYEERGSSKTQHIDKYIYFDRALSEYPRVLELKNIDHPDINRQFFDFKDFKKFLELPSSFNWDLVSNNEITQVLSGSKKCEALFPEGSLRFEEYRSVN